MQGLGSHSLGSKDAAADKGTLLPVGVSHKRGFGEGELLSEEDNSAQIPSKDWEFLPRVNPTTLSTGFLPPST